MSEKALQPATSSRPQPTTDIPSPLYEGGSSHTVFLSWAIVVKRPSFAENFQSRVARDIEPLSQVCLFGGIHFG